MVTAADKEIRVVRDRYVQVDHDSDELEQLYRERYRTFRDILAGVVGSHDLAREVVQEAFARALREREKFRAEGSLEAWVWRIAFNVALKMRRDLRRQWEQIDPPAVFETVLDHDVRAAIRTLPPRRRLVLFLRYFADLSYAEIATALDLSEGTVAATLAKAREDLGQRLDPERVSG
jgi:RNA polymerase sigma factor (sigma-70 family)